METSTIILNGIDANQLAGFKFTKVVDPELELENGERFRFVGEEIAGGFVYANDSGDSITFVEGCIESREVLIELGDSGRFMGKADFPNEYSFALVERHKATNFRNADYAQKACDLARIGHYVGLDADERYRVTA